MRTPFSSRSNALAARLAALCALAQLVLLSANLWHHHDHAEESGHDCTVCLTLAAERTDGPPAPARVMEASAVVEVLTPAAEADRSVLVIDRARSRGQPAG